MSLQMTSLLRGTGIPIVSFSGATGGAGTTTITRRFAELITSGEWGSNVLLMDVDTHSAGLTNLLRSESLITCNNVHEYVFSRNVSVVEAVNVTASVKFRGRDAGQLFFIPASSPYSEQVFSTSASIGPQMLMEALHEVILKATQGYHCGCVVIDCGSIVDPYTAAAANLADIAFIIGQNNATSFSSLRTYRTCVKDFYPGFGPEKMKVVINKVRAWERLEERKLQGQEDIFAAIPFLIALTDASEGLVGSDQEQMRIFEDNIIRIIKAVFAVNHPELIPSQHRPQRVKARFYKGVFAPSEPCDLPEGCEVELTVEMRPTAVTGDRVERNRSASLSVQHLSVEHVVYKRPGAKRGRRTLLDGVLHLLPKLRTNRGEALLSSVDELPRQPGDQAIEKAWEAYWKLYPVEADYFVEDRVQTGSFKRMAGDSLHLARGSRIAMEKINEHRWLSDWVDCTVFAPPSAPEGESFLVQVFAHTPEQAPEATRLAMLVDQHTIQRGFKGLSTEIPRGARLTFDLVMPGLEVDDPVQSLIWKGRPEAVQFGVTIPREHGPRTVIGTVTVSQNSVPVGHIKFKLEITAASLAQPMQEPKPVCDGRRRYTKAFVSYSMKDLDKVRPRVQMLTVQGIDYFHDKFDLEPGDRWEKKLYLNIDQCDLFLLFWSSAAKESDWVRKEVNYALGRKAGDDFAPPEIYPVIIEGPPVPEPWEEVKHIQFDDWRVHYHA